MGSEVLGSETKVWVLRSLFTPATLHPESGPEVRVWVLGFGFWDLGSELVVRVTDIFLDSCSVWVLGSGFWVLDSELAVRVTDFF